MSQRLLGWWYVSIGMGFAALGVRSYIARVPMWSAGLRFLVAVGFIALGAMTLRQRSRPK